MRGAWRAALIGALAAAITTLPGLGVGTLWDNSETAYGEVAREILLSGNWVVMHLNGRPWFIQPPLYFWLAALFAKLFGTSEFALRLPSALATIAMGGALGYAVARARDLRTAILASVVLATALMQAVVGRLAIMDALLDLAVAVAILAWYGAARGGPRRLWYLGAAAIALGILAKGPVALAIPAIVLVPWAVWERRAGTPLVLPSLRDALLATALGAALIAPWALALLRAAGPAAFSLMIGHYTVGRYLGTIENQSGPLWYYVPVVILGFFPWSAFLLPALADAWRAARSREGSLARFALVWTVVPFVFFSFAQTKLPNYIALELPALAILVALWFDAVADAPKRRAALAWTALVPAGVAVLGFALWAFSHDNRLTSDLQQLRSDFAGLGLVVLAGWFAMWLLWRSRERAWFAPFALAGASAVAMTIIAVLGEPLVERFKPIPQLAAIVQRDRRPGDAVAIEGVSGGNALLFYTAPVVAQLAAPGDPGESGDGDFRHAVCAAPRVFVVTSPQDAIADPSFGRTRRIVARAGRDLLVLYEGAPCAD
ncbi:MAG: glycosyltransferase family 39 protein [Vulcanimicrobiaceae bacterium]